VSIDEYLSALRNVPPLDGAECTDSAPMFDETQDVGVIEACKSICASCPSQIPCASWAQAQPAGTLNGVIGGAVYHWDGYRNHRRKTA